MQVVYIDVLFLINFSMDFLALYLSGTILHLPSKRLPLLFASALGGIYSIATAFFGGNTVLSLLTGVATAGLLPYVAYGRECKKQTYFLLIALFFGVSSLLGGMITAFYEALRGFFSEREDLLSLFLEGDGRLALFFAFALVCALILLLGGRKYRYRIRERTEAVTIYEGAAKKSVLALIDSGNTLCDPLSGKPCILINPDAAKEVIPKDILQFSKEGWLDPQTIRIGSQKRIRLIPTHSVGGERLLVGYIPEKLTIGEGERMRAVNAVLVLDTSTRGFCGNDALIPDMLYP